MNVTLPLSIPYDTVVQLRAKFEQLRSEHAKSLQEFLKTYPRRLRAAGSSPRKLQELNLESERVHTTDKMMTFNNFLRAVLTVGAQDHKQPVPLEEMSRLIHDQGLRLGRPKK